MSKIIKDFWKLLLTVWKDQRGEAGDDDDPDDGDPVNDPTDLDDDPDGDRDNDQTGEGGDDPGSGDGAGGTGDDEPDPEPTMRDVLSRLDSFEQRFEQLSDGGTQTGGTTTQDGGGRQPADGGGEKQETEAERVGAGIVRMNDVNHPYDGRTLKEVFDTDPDFAFQLAPRQAAVLQYAALRQQDAQSQALEDDRRRVEEESNQFATEFAKEAFSKGVEALTDEEKSQVDEMTSKVKQWMLDNDKVGITVSEAHILMSHKGLLGKAASKAVGKVLDDAQRGRVRTIATGKDGNASTTAQDMSKWTPDQMLNYVDGLSSSEFSKFMSAHNKPNDPVRKAFPDMPWPD